MSPLPATAAGPDKANTRLNAEMALKTSRFPERTPDFLAIILALPSGRENSLFWQAGPFALARWKD
jgi:hypothetical protein